MLRQRRLYSASLRSAPNDHDLQPGQLLGPYELLVPVGAGGMASVWAARHRGTGHIFALKMLMPHLAGNEAFREMFFDEARIASRIHHENVARTFELTDLQGILTLVMEWVDGSSLVQMLRPNGKTREDAPLLALPLREAVRILAETCAGLHAAHELVGDEGRPLAVVHRDVSPHNILLTRSGHVKVTDFGVAKAIGKSHMTIAGQVKGKLAYMSPEQLVGGGIDRRSDIFALGSVLYELTTGERPFKGEHDPQIMAAIVMGNLQRPSEVVRSFPHALEDIVMCALANEPDQRFGTAWEMKQALEGWLASSGPPVGAHNVAALLQERCGAELDSRAGALSITQQAPPIPTSQPHLHVEGGAVMDTSRRRGEPPPEGVSTIAAIIAMLIGAVLGLGVLAGVKSARLERRGPVTSLDASSASPLTTPSSTPALAIPSQKPSAAELEDGAVTRSTDVILHLPNGARLFVDGRELPPGSTSVPRPSAGVVTILVKAEGREDTVVEVKPTSPGDLEVAMAHKSRPAGKSSASAGPDPATITAPPNPYE